MTSGPVRERVYNGSLAAGALRSHLSGKICVQQKMVMREEQESGLSPVIFPI
jgi:hypothetical protein